jgi:hypothetical protein
MSGAKIFMRRIANIIPSRNLANPAYERLKLHEKI